MQSHKRHLTRPLRLAFTAALALAAAVGTVAATGTGAPASTSAMRHFRPGTVRVVRLEREGAPSYLWVYRPSVPDSARLPVVYFLHGWPGKPGDAFRFAHLASMVDEYIASGGTPVVIAAPDGNSPVHSDTEWGDASDGSDAVESFIVDTVIPTVEGSHPRDAAHRAIAVRVRISTAGSKPPASPRRW